MMKTFIIYSQQLSHIQYGINCSYAVRYLSYNWKFVVVAFFFFYHLHLFFPNNPSFPTFRNHQSVLCSCKFGFLVFY